MGRAAGHAGRPPICGVYLASWGGLLQLPDGVPDACHAEVLAVGQPVEDIHHIVRRVVPPRVVDALLFGAGEVEPLEELRNLRSRDHSLSTLLDLSGLALLTSGPLGPAEESGCNYCAGICPSLAPEDIADADRGAVASGIARRLTRPREVAGDAFASPGQGVWRRVLC